MFDDNATIPELEARIERLRFWELVSPEPTSGCWLWTGKTWNGYGKFIVGGRTMAAHRYAYELFSGPIPDGLELDHVCRVRSCVNPAHLEACTHRENTNRRDRANLRV
jgi:HNH endonuclease